ncbi:MULTISPECIES: DUF1192 domain-containing protein [unclassified Thalassospira]|uniref:DUF1192 domain-containing protein n=1 Tax=unclassified Thalassospira TaxID=2648997 RepID=UPI0025DBB493|nr:MULTISPECIES: DUF1192 domain-containing protein [unclassified Thalassospira]
MTEPGRKQWRMIVDEEDGAIFKGGEFGLPRNLEGMSVDNLKDYRAALEREIKHVDEALTHRKGAVAGAEALFKN